MALQLGFRNYFILKQRFLTTAIFIGSASTVLKSFNVLKLRFLVLSRL